MALDFNLTPNLMAETDTLTPARVNAVANLSASVTGTFSDLDDGPNATPALGEVLTWDGTRYNPESVGLVPELAKGVQVWRDASNTGRVHMNADFVVLRKITSGDWASPTALLTVESPGELYALLDATTTGAGYVDALPTLDNTYYNVWMISNGTTPAIMFSTADGITTFPTLPATYVWGAIISTVFCIDGTPLVGHPCDIRQFVQVDRVIHQEVVEQFTATVGPGTGTWTAVDLLATQAVPTNCKSVLGIIGLSNTGTADSYAAAVILSATTRLGAVPGSGAALGRTALAQMPGPTAIGTFYAATNFDIPTVSASTIKTIAWKAPATAARYRMEITGYTI